jgi:hypothetical protein
MDPSSLPSGASKMIGSETGRPPAIDTPTGEGQAGGTTRRSAIRVERTDLAPVNPETLFSRTEPISPQRGGKGTAGSSAPQRRFASVLPGSSSWRTVTEVERQDASVPSTAESLRSRHEKYVFATTYLPVNEERFKEMVEARERKDIARALKLYYQALALDEAEVSKGFDKGGSTTQLTQIPMDVVILLPLISGLLPGLSAAIAGASAYAILLPTLPFIATYVGQTGLYYGELNRSGGFSNRNQTIKKVPSLADSLQAIYKSVQALHRSRATLTAALDRLEHALNDALNTPTPSHAQVAALEGALQDVLKAPLAEGEHAIPDAGRNPPGTANDILGRTRDAALPTELAYFLEADLGAEAGAASNAGPKSELQARMGRVDKALESRAIRERNDNTYYLGKLTQSIVSVSRQVFQFFAPVLGNKWAEHHGVGPRRSDHFTLLVQALILLAARSAQILLASPFDERRLKQPATVRLTLETTDFRDKEGAVDKAKLRGTWRTQDAVRMQNVSDMVKHRIAQAHAGLRKIMVVTEAEVKALEIANGFNFQPLMAPMSDGDHDRLNALRNRRDAPDSVTDVSREEMLEWIELERRANEPRSQSEEGELGSLMKKFETSTMSHADWSEVVSGGVEPLERDDGGIHGGARSEDEAIREDRRQSRCEAAKKSLKPLEHARLEALRVRPAFIPGQGPVDAGTTVLGHGDAPPGIRSRASSMSKEQFLASDDASRTKAFNALMGACDDADTLQKLRHLLQELTDARLDSRLLRWAWEKTSTGTQQSLRNLYLNGQGDWRNALDSSAIRLVQRNHFVPAFMQRWSAYFLFLVGGSATGYAVNQGFKLARAILFPAGTHDTKALEAFLSLRIEVRFGILSLAILGACAAGFLSERNADVRRKFSSKGENLPPLGVMLTMELLYGMFIAVPSQIVQRTVRGPAAKSIARHGMTQASAAMQRGDDLVARTNQRLRELQQAVHKIPIPGTGHRLHQEIRT